MYIHVHVCKCVNNYVHVHVPLAIIKGPQDRTVYQEKLAVFTCQTGGGDFVGWKVNGTGPTSLPHEVQEDLHERLVDGERSTLTILARAAYNGTTVQCVTVLFGGDVVGSENATLTIQGIQSHSLYMQYHMTKLHTCTYTCRYNVSPHSMYIHVCTLLLR